MVSVACDPIYTMRGLRLPSKWANLSLGKSVKPAAASAGFHCSSTSQLENMPVAGMLFPGLVTNSIIFC